MKGVFIFLFIFLGIIVVSAIAYFIKITFFKNVKMPWCLADLPESDSEADLSELEFNELHIVRENMENV